MSRELIFRSPKSDSIRSNPALAWVLVVRIYKSTMDLIVLHDHHMLEDELLVYTSQCSALTCFHGAFISSTLSSTLPIHNIV